MATIVFLLDELNVESISSDEDSSDDSDTENIFSLLGKEKMPKNAVMSYYEITVQG